MTHKTERDAEDFSLPSPGRSEGLRVLSWGFLPQGCMDGGCVSGLKWKEAGTKDTFSFMGGENPRGVMKLQRAGCIVG